MLVQSVHYAFGAEDGDRAEAMFRELRDASRKEEGVIAFEVVRSAEHPNIFALWEVYRDQRALDEHRAAEHFQRLVINGVRPLAQQRSAEVGAPI